MIQSFGNQGTNDVFHDRNTREARQICPKNIWNVAQRKLDILHNADDLGDVGALPGNNLEKLGGSWSGFYSIRVNEQYRVAFQWTEHGPEEVQIVDYH